MPVKVCLSPGCPSPASYRGRCQAHSRQRERTINRVGRKVYSTKKWQMTRRRKLFLNPLCENCGAIAEHVHHKQGVENDAWSMEELASLCASCHGRITREEQAA